ncbi:MAG: response regulator [Chloroflexota bacterium]
MTNPLAFIIEDDEQLANIFSIAFQDAKFDTEVLRNGRVALERLKQISPLLVVLDMHLPHVSGKEILQFIRSEPKLEQVSVLLATADPGLAENLEDDVDLVLIKPISFIQLRDLAKRFHPNF